MSHYQTSMIRSLPPTELTRIRRSLVHNIDGGVAIAVIWVLDRDNRVRVWKTRMPSDT